jgi:hypothetical protein
VFRKAQADGLNCSDRGARIVSNRIRPATVASQTFITNLDRSPAHRARIQIAPRIIVHYELDEPLQVCRETSSVCLYVVTTCQLNGSPNALVIHRVGQRKRRNSEALRSASLLRFNWLSVCGQSRAIRIDRSRVVQPEGVIDMLE